MNSPWTQAASLMAASAGTFEPSACTMNACCTGNDCRDISRNFGIIAADLDIGVLGVGVVAPDGDVLHLRTYD